MNPEQTIHVIQSLGRIEGTLDAIAKTRAFE